MVSNEIARQRPNVEPAHPLQVFQRWARGELKDALKRSLHPWGCRPIGVDFKKGKHRDMICGVIVQMRGREDRVDVSLPHRMIRDEGPKTLAEYVAAHVEISVCESIVRKRLPCLDS